MSSSQVCICLSLLRKPSVPLVGGLLPSLQRGQLSVRPHLSVQSAFWNGLFRQPSVIIFCSPPIFMNKSLFLMSALSFLLLFPLQLKVKN